MGTATGRVFAAFLPPKITEAMAKQELHREHRGATHPPWKEIEATLADVRKRGLARAVGQPIPGLNAFSAPVFDHTRAIVLAITALGPAGTFDAAWNSPIAKALLATTEALSRRLGFS